MKKRRRSNHLQWIGFFLMLGGVVLPLLIVIHISKANFFMMFFSYFLSLSGLILEILGLIGYGDDVLPPGDEQ